MEKAFQACGNRKQARLPALIFDKINFEPNYPEEVMRVISH